MQRFKTLRKLVHAKEIDLQLVKGIGDVKANYLYRTLHVPFNRITKPRPIPVASKDKPASKPMHDFLEKFNSPSGSEISGPDKGKQVERRAVLDVLEATAGAAAAEAAVAQAETRAWEAWEDYDGGSPEWD
ncbi:hypothetical protein BC936DRAFT_145296 [Jimgerdemannia flammicorona]|uniref:Uncharacterized protein n=1 Tax=Jimgerdemannia flammicorona TaxID=994334 RepID=A0A433DAD2_9FUNG|nr:hypothetical protein BC936DRAFT_145296 [Jimgerdemannia flammicorona]